jgi:hypothetical protein
MEEEYICKECGKSVRLIDGEVIRSCDHKGTVTAAMSAVATGESSLEQE